MTAGSYAIGSVSGGETKERWDFFKCFSRDLWGLSIFYPGIYIFFVLLRTSCDFSRVF